MMKFFSNYFFAIFCLAFFLTRIPPFYIFLIKNSLVSSYNVAGYLLFFVLAGETINHYINGRKFYTNKSLVTLILLFFISQSLSIITTVNVAEFLARYKNIVFGLMILFITLIEVDSEIKAKSIINLIFFSIIVNIFLEFILYFKPVILFDGLKSILDQQYLLDFTINSGRDRYFVDIYDAGLIPLLFIIFGNLKKTVQKIGIVLVSICLACLSFLSNFRTQLVVLFISTIVGAGFYFKKIKYIFMFFFLGIMVFYTVNLITANHLGYNALDRLISPDVTDYTTVNDRFYYWRQAFDMGMSSPILGIGLGNYFDYLPGNKNVNYSLMDPNNDFFKITWVHPHNIFFGTFAETGFFGLITLSAMLIFFVIYDLKVIFKGKRPTPNLLIVSFWSIFLFSLINPATSVSYFGIFWIIRGLIFSKIYNKHV